jgi:signal peptidase I
MDNNKTSKNPFSLKNEAFDWMEAIVFALVTVVIIFTFLFRIVIVSGSSMVPTLKDGDRLVLNSAFYKEKAGDIVVVLKEGVNNDRPIIKRIIATAGQTVDIDYEKQLVIIDGVARKEDYIAEMSEERGDVELPATVPEGCVFVMGDNRNNSLDSRTSSVGMVKLNEIKGHAVVRLFPLNKFGLLNNK